MPEVTTKTGKENWEYVTIPERDRIMDWQHPGIGLNQEHFGPGKHMLPPDKAAFVRFKLEEYEKSLIRILQPKPRKEALGVRNQGASVTVYDASDTAPSVI